MYSKFMSSLCGILRKRREIKSFRKANHSLYTRDLDGYAIITNDKFYSLCCFCYLELLFDLIKCTLRVHRIFIHSGRVEKVEKHCFRFKTFLDYVFIALPESSQCDLPEKHYQL